MATLAACGDDTSSGGSNAGGRSQGGGGAAPIGGNPAGGSGGEGGAGGSSCLETGLECPTDVNCQRACCSGLVVGNNMGQFCG